MGQALYRKYRSKSLDEIVGQEHITETLKKAIESGRINHAYLFTGPRGVGKTSIARILAYQINQMPYVNEGNQLDIIEIDAASTGGVDEIRELREKVHVAPAIGKFKVYIIDEVHMMTTPAFNALLKTLEEPPAHVVFVLATTEAHKLPATIISRTQRYTFRPVELAKVIQHLKNIAKKEKIEIDDDALALIAEQSEGSIRDGIGLLDQASGLHGHISRVDLEKFLGLPSKTAIEAIISLLIDKDAKKLISHLSVMKTNGYQASAIAKQLSKELRLRLVEERLPISKLSAIELLRRLIDVFASPNPDQLLELTLIENTLANEPQSFDQQLGDRQSSSKKLIKDEQSQTPKASPISDFVTEPIERSDSNQILDEFTANLSHWQKALDKLKSQYNTLYGIMKPTTPQFQPGKIVISFHYAFHQKRANDKQNKQLIEQVLKEITGHQLKIECIYDKNLAKSVLIEDVVIDANEHQMALSAPLDIISNIFGGGELVEL